MNFHSTRRPTRGAAILLRGLIFLLVVNLAGIDRCLAFSQADLDNARQELARWGDQLSQLEGKLRSKLNFHDELKKKLQVINEEYNRLERRVGNIRLAKKEYEQKREKANREFIAIRDQIGKAVDSLDNVFGSEIYAYYFKTAGRLTANLRTGTYWVRFDLPMGLSLESKEIEQLLRGIIPYPSGNPIKMALEGQGVGYQVRQEDHYAAFQNNLHPVWEYGSSRRFVEFASSETVINDVFQAYATAGSSAKNSLENLARQILLEWNDVVAWLQFIGVEQLEEAATFALYSLVNRGNVPLQHLRLAFFPGKIRYDYYLEPRGFSRKIAELLGVSIPPSQGISSLHLGFKLSLEGGGPPLDPWQRWQQLEAGGPLPMAALFNQVLSRNPEVGNMFRHFYYTDLIDQRFAGPMISWIINTLGLQMPVLNMAYNGYPKIDLSQTLVGQVQQALHPFTAGNAGSVEVNQCFFDLPTSTFHLYVTLHHRQSWGSPQQARAAVVEWLQQTGRQVGLGLAGGSQQSASQLEAALRQKEREYREANAKVEQEDKKLRREKEDEERLRRRRAAVDRDLDRVSREIQNLEGDIAGLRQYIANLNQGIQDMIKHWDGILVENDPGPAIGKALRDGGEFIKKVIPF